MSGRQFKDFFEYVVLNALVVGALFAFNYWCTPKSELTETELMLTTVENGGAGRLNVVALGC